MNERIYQYGQHDLRRERIFSGLTMVLVPVPCLLGALWLARQGMLPLGWAFLGASLFLEILISIDHNYRMILITRFCYFQSFVLRIRFL